MPTDFDTFEGRRSHRNQPKSEEHALAMANGDGDETLATLE
jgi:hypothetical protein